MSQVGYTPISIYYSSTSTNVPSASNLVAGELAINTADGRLFYKDSAGVVQTIATKDATSGSFTNLAYSGTLTGGTGVVNLGSGQFYKDASGNVGIGTSSPSYKLDVLGERIRLQNGNSGAWLSHQIQNETGSAFYIGQESSTGGTFVGSAYARFLWSTGAYPLVIATNSTERMRIDSDGNLLVGGTNSTGKITITQPTQASYAYGVSFYYSGSSYWNIVNGASNRLYFGYGAVDKAYVDSSTGAWNAISDLRLKKNISSIQYGLNTVLQLHPVQYNMNEQEDEDSKQLGFIAQETLKVVPEAVSEMMGGMYGMDKSQIIPILVKAIQELKAELDVTKAEVAALKAK